MNLRGHHPSNAPGQRRAGFSLVEVMVAILILGLSLAVLVHGITTALSSSKESELQTTAILFAQGKVDELRATFLLDGEEEGNCGAGLEIYQWKQSVTPTDIEGLHAVEVVIQHARTGQQICDLRTMLFEVPNTAEPDEKAAKSKQDGEGRK